MEPYLLPRMARIRQATLARIRARSLEGAPRSATCVMTMATTEMQKVPHVVASAALTRIAIGPLELVSGRWAKETAEGGSVSIDAGHAG